MLCCLLFFAYMTDYYQTLGVDRTATPDDIKRAYRRMASQHHPDKGGDKTRFQEIQAAYETLSDPNKRAAHDNPNPFGPGHSFGAGNPFGSPAGFNFESIFDVFGARFHQQQRRQQAHMTLWVTLTDVALAGKKTISVGTHQGNMTVEIEIPAGINDGDSVQYGGIGPGGMDLVITFRIHSNPKWQRQGANLIVDYELSVWDLILGGDTQVEDILGNRLSLNVPPRTQPGTTFRLRGRGLRQRNAPAGDLLIRVQAVLPEPIPQTIIDAIAQTRSQ
jgi:DnaJ-class molecular chaperone